MDTPFQPSLETQGKAVTAAPRLGGCAAIVTGGSYGIGLATARQLLLEGARVAIIARDDHRLAAAARELEDLSCGAPFLACPGDVSNEADIRIFFERAEEVVGNVDILINNAGYHQASPVEQMSYQDWSAMLSTHAGGAFLFSRQAFRRWKQRGCAGRIVIVASKSGIAATPNATAYAAAKAAQIHLARCLAEEGGPSGIRVNCVLPDGVIRGTDIFTQEQRVANAARHGVSPEQLELFYARRNALKAGIMPEDVAKAIVFLCGDDSQTINGAAITVDGGVTTAYLR